MWKLFVSIIAVLACILSANAEKEKGVGDSLPADDDVNKLIDRFKSDIMDKICEEVNRRCPFANATIDVDSYKKKSVTGTNFLVRAWIGNQTFDFNIFSNPSSKTELLQGIRGPKEDTDEIEFF